MVPGSFVIVLSLRSQRLRSGRSLDDFAQDRFVEGLGQEPGSAFVGLRDQLLVGEGRDEHHGQLWQVPSNLGHQLGAEYQRHAYVTDDEVIWPAQATLG